MTASYTPLSQSDIRPNPESLLRPENAADFLCVSRRTLEAWRHRGGGPRYVRISSRCIRYERSDLIDWKNSRRQEHTAQ